VRVEQQLRQFVCMTFDAGRVELDDLQYRSIAARGLRADGGAAA
jgi:hypothetical protein